MPRNNLPSKLIIHLHHSSINSKERKRKKEKKGSPLTVQSFRTEGAHDVGHCVVEERRPHGIAYGKLSGRFHEEATVLKGSHSVGPCLAARVYEAGVDPAGHFVYLQPHVITAILALFSANTLLASALAKRPPRY